MWIPKLQSMEFQSPELNHAEIYSRLKGFYNFVIGSSGMQAKEESKRLDIEKIRASLNGGGCKLYILSHKKQKHLILEYPNPQNEIYKNPNLVRSFSQWRFYLLPPSEYFVFSNGAKINMADFRIDKVVSEKDLYDQLVDHKDKLSADYKIQKINLSLEDYASLKTNYVRNEGQVDWGLNEYSDPIDFDPEVKRSPASEAKPARTFEYRGRKIILSKTEFDRFLKEVIAWYKKPGADSAKTDMTIRGFLMKLQLDLNEQGIADPEIKEVLMAFLSLYPNLSERYRR